MKRLFFLLFLIFLFLTYTPWLNLTKTLSSGDWPYLFSENIKEIQILQPPFLWLEPYYQLTAKIGVEIFSLSWEITEKIFWFYPFIIISIISSYFFLKYLARELGINKNTSIYVFVGSLIFTTNTYILMLAGGGQMGVAVAYSMTPLVLLLIFKLIDLNNSLNFNSKLYISTILAFGVQLMFDPRMFFLSILISLLYILFNHKKINIFLFKKLILILIFTIGINMFWILPNFGYFNTEYKSAIDAVSASFLSFATFSNSISLLHPNWPENIFGKIGFMKPEFILIPILAFSSLLFSNKNKIILFFNLLALLGAFLSKGTNPPFGEVYEWLTRIPGFSVFRDPTKFYVLVIVSYMVLVPLSIYCFTDWFNSKFKIQKYGATILALLFFIYWLFLISPAVFGQLTGTFKPHDVPEEYVNFKNFLISQPEFTKTLWIPSVERFGFNSATKPAISAMELFGVSSVSGVLNKFNTAEIKKQLLDEEVEYIIVPDDYLKEIFIVDRKYDDKLYLETVDRLSNITWLSGPENKNFGKIRVFKILN